MWFERLMQPNRRRTSSTRAFRKDAVELLEQRSLLSALTVQLGAEHDNTIYDVVPGDMSNGSGQYIVAGGATGTAAA
ncbi:MAG: hypothetical protein WCO86_20025, partial [Planctomycetota bacterium]